MNALNRCLWSEKYHLCKSKGVISGSFKPCWTRWIQVIRAVYFSSPTKLCLTSLISCHTWNWMWAGLPTPVDVDLTLYTLKETITLKININKDNWYDMTINKVKYVHILFRNDTKPTSLWLRRACGLSVLPLGAAVKPRFPFMPFFITSLRLILIENNEYSHSW